MASFRETFSKSVSDFLYTCFVLLLVAIVIWSFGSFFLSVAAFLVLAIGVLAPLLALLIPVFIVYLMIRWAFDTLRKP